jgi:hypothetical protein
VHYGTSDSKDEQMCDEDGSDRELEDEDLVDAVEEIALADAYRLSDDLFLYLNFDDLSVIESGPCSTNSSPHKHHHTNIF